MHRRTFTFAAASAALAGWQLPARAQAWPERPVRLWLSQPAGSGADAMARMIGDQLARRWSQPLVVENRPGGQNAIGASAAAKSAADGHNFYFATAAALVTNAYLFKSLPYDPKKDFVPVGMVGKVPFAVSVNPNSPLKSLPDLVAYAKANPGKLAVANEGPKTFSGMMTRLLSAQLGIQVNAVPYVSVSAGVTDTVGGQTEVIVSDVPFDRADGQGRQAAAAGGDHGQARGRMGHCSEHRRVRSAGLRLRRLDRHRGAGRYARGSDRALQPRPGRRAGRPRDGRPVAGHRPHDRGRGQRRADGRLPGG